MAEKENRLLEQQGRRPKPGPYITKKKKPGLGSLSKKKKDVTS